MVLSTQANAIVTQDNEWNKQITEPVTFDVIIEQPHSDVNEYAYGAPAHVIRLESVVRIGDPALANRGIVVGAVTPRARSVRSNMCA
jgi:hypothetical protein